LRLFAEIVSNEIGENDGDERMNLNRFVRKINFNLFF
jgi:hypothetical protein